MTSSKRSIDAKSPVWGVGWEGDFHIKRTGVLVIPFRGFGTSFFNLIGVKKFQATPTKQDLGTSLGLF